MDPASAIASIALMAASASASLFMRHQRLGAAAGFASMLGMADGAGTDRLFSPVVWFGVITALVIAAAWSHRVRAAHDATASQPTDGRSVAAFGGCSNLVMGVLILQAAAGDSVTQMTHAMPAGLSTSTLLAVAIALGLVCIWAGVRAAIRGQGIALVVEMGGMGASVIVMAVAMA